MDSEKKEKNRRKLPPARTPEARENQLISLAVDLAERQLRDGSASSQVITHFLKLATVRAELENKKISADVKLSEEKVRQIKAEEERAKVYEEVLQAMSEYRGESHE